jgi:hypothetical protein
MLLGTLRIEKKNSNCIMDEQNTHNEINEDHSEMIFKNFL